MSLHTWIRYRLTEAGERTGVKTLRMTDATAAALADRLNAATTWHRAVALDPSTRELDVITAWPAYAPSIEYVRAEPSTPHGRQDRDLRIGAALIRRFDLVPHIVVHRAIGVVLWDDRNRATQTPESWAARNETCSTACRDYVVGTHATNDPDEVTCKGCIAATEAATVLALVPGPRTAVHSGEQVTVRSAESRYDGRDGEAVLPDEDGGFAVRIVGEPDLLHFEERELSARRLVGATGGSAS